MRPIDANALHKKISEWPESVMYKDWVQSAIANAPTIAPQPNDPLTLEELREMDGEPVYVFFVDGHQGWVILDIFGKSSDSRVTLYGPDMESYEEQRLDFLNTNGEGPAGYDGWQAYRRKPEEEPT